MNEQVDRSQEIEVPEIDDVSVEALEDASGAGWCVGSAGTFGCPSSAGSYGTLSSH